MEVSTIARVRRIDAGQVLLPIFDEDGAQITIGGEHNRQGDSTSVIARHEASDVRAKRIFNQEYHHFSDQVANILVVDVSAVSDGMSEWPAEFARLFQPVRNRKVGAAVFFDQGSVGPAEAIRRRWQVVANPHAHLDVPDRLLLDIESMDESKAWGLERRRRLVAS